MAARRVDLAISDGLRQMEARRDADPDHREDVHASAEVLDDGAIVLDTALVPWALPRPPDAPPPRKRKAGSGAHGPAPDYERRAYVEQLWRAQYSTPEIVDIVTQRYPCAEGTVRHDVERVRRYYLKHAQVSPDELAIRREQMVATLNDLAREARADGDRSTARYCYDKIARILGLYAPTKIEATTTQNVNVNLQIEQIVAHLDAAGLAALEVVLLQLEAKGIVKAPGSGSDGVAPATPALGPGSVIDVVEGDDEIDEVDLEGDD